jgi:ELWxxDGT repeat protein
MRTTLLLILLCSALAANAQSPLIVKDSWPGATGISPIRLLTYDDRLCFHAGDGMHGIELWEYLDQDTPKMVADIYPGGNSSGSCPEDDHMVVFGNKLYFQSATWDSVLGRPTGDELFVYDRVSAPKLVYQLGIRPPGSNPNGLIVAGSKLFFLADSNNNGYYLYSYDGSTAPRVYPIKPDYMGIPSRSLGEYNNNLFFSYDSLNGKGKELYTLNPVTNTWKMIADINPGPLGSLPSGWLTAWNKLFFIASDSTYGRELYSYDGKTVKRLTDLAPGTKNSMAGTFHRLIAYKGAIYFNGSATGTSSPQELYKWDSATGIAIKISPAGLDLVNNFRPVVFNSELYFYGKTSATGCEVWKYDGTTCKMVTDLNPGTADGKSMGELAVYKDVLYFSGNNGKTGFELYRIYPSTNSVTSVKWQGKAVVYPNPANTFATLSITLPFAQLLRVSLMDVSGREVFNSGLNSLNAGTSEIRLPIANLGAGQYFYRIDDGKGLALAQGSLIRL